jgi:hypothetical protein
MDHTQNWSQPRQCAIGSRTRFTCRPLMRCLQGPGPSQSCLRGLYAVTGEVSLRRQPGRHLAARWPGRAGPVSADRAAAAGGPPHVEIARRCGAPVPTVREWHARYRAGESARWGDPARSGQPRSVDETAITAAPESPPCRLGHDAPSSLLLGCGVDRTTPQTGASESVPVVMRAPTLADEAIFSRPYSAGKLFELRRSLP